MAKAEISLNHDPVSLEYRGLILIAINARRRDRAWRKNFLHLGNSEQLLGRHEHRDGVAGIVLCLVIGVAETHPHPSNDH